MADDREIEIKLALSAADVVVLQDVLARLGAEQGKTQLLRSVYFDTPRHRLHRHGSTLRIRDSGGQLTQTVKTHPEGAGLFARGEWEKALDRETPDRRAIAATPAAMLLSKGKRQRKLAPVFTVAVERAVWTLHEGSAAIEIALDQGDVRAADRAAPINELELELKQGDAPALFGLLRKLAEQHPLRIGVRSKSERGYALLAETDPACFKAETVALDRGMTAGDAFKVIALRCLRQFRLNEPLLLATRGAEPLHQARVALRRLRSALSLFAPIVADDAYDDMKVWLRDVAAILGEARNLDVYMARELALPRRGKSSAAFRVALKKRRDAAYRRVAAAIDCAAFRHRMLDLLVWIENGAWTADHRADRQNPRDQPVGAFAERVLRRLSRQFRRKARHIDSLDPQARHRVRIKAKKLRYAAEFFAALAGGKQRKRHKAFVAALEKPQEDLGALNDIQTGHQIAGDLAQGDADDHRQVAVATRRAAARQDRRTAGLLRSAAKACRTFRTKRRFWSKSWGEAEA